MNYPVWELYTAGGGFLIALIAVVHVYVAHFAVGGGLFLVLTERKALRANDSGMLDYVRRHTRFFLLLTMVFGGVTGVGIWFTIALLNPGATSTLIHTFVFGWAAEWVCFTGEIVALFVYFYTFGKMKPHLHQRIGWLYFIFAWLSLFLINGIICFMLTPGLWPENQSFWSGFFNPTMWPSLLFRSAIAFMAAGIFGFVTGMFIQDDALRTRMNRYCAQWIIIPLIVMAAAGLWYFNALPQEIRAMMLKGSPELMPYLKTAIAGAVILFTGSIVLALKAPLPAKKVLAFFILAIGLVFMGGFEFLREGGRRPWVIYGHTYANAIHSSDEAVINRDGFLPTARWTSRQTITPETRLSAGKEIFRIQCMSCHSIGGPMNDILPLTEKFSVFAMDAVLDGLGRLSPYMPPFMGSPEERDALARYIVTGLHLNVETPEAPAGNSAVPPDIPDFDPAASEYVLLAWNTLGMHCISDSDAYWVLLPPSNDLYAQLIRRDPLPEVITDGITLRYRIEPGFETPSKHVDFWKYAGSNFGKRPASDTGLSGNGMMGEMTLNEDLYTFEATGIPVVPYTDGGAFNPYPLMTIEAVETESGNVLATTKAVTPTSTEMGCRNCHGGSWRVDGKAGFTAATAADVLAVHDRRNNTNLLAMAEKGQPQLCQSCHPDPILGAEGKPELLNLPAAIHGWHANYLTGRGAEACFQCHPSDPTGPTRCLRDGHSDTLDCTSCHGFMEDHTLSLLKHELHSGKAGAKKLMKHLNPRKAASLAKVNPRVPWINEPDCLNCHEDFTRPDPATADGFNTWTVGKEGLFRMRHDESGVMMCAACHSSPHATHPAAKAPSKGRDSIQPMQYQNNDRTIGFQKCSVCHTLAMEDPIHHVMGETVFLEE